MTIADLDSNAKSLTRLLSLQTVTVYYVIKTVIKLILEIHTYKINLYNANHYSLT